MENKSSSSGGIGFVGLLQVAFIVLKLCGVIKWKWWQVLLPAEISIAVVVLTIVGMLIFFKKLGGKR